MADEVGRVDDGLAALAHRMVPDQLQHERGNDQVGGRVQVTGLAELAPFDAALHQPTDHLMGGQGHFVVEEARNFREVAGFSKDELHDATHLRLAEAAPPAFQHVGQQLFAAAGGLLDVVTELLDDRQDGGAHHGLEEVFLAGVIQVERALGHACTRGHVIQAGGGIAPGHEDFQRGVQQFAGALFLAALPGAGGACIARGWCGRVHLTY